jgi:hypothetical protein
MAENLLTLDSPPGKSKILYHYCTEPAFWAIIEKGAFWLSNALSLNDFTENQWGKNALYRIFRENYKNFDRAFFDFVTQNIEIVHRNTRPFVGSFSEREDLLDQWRAYGDNGSGFALGFDANQIHLDWGVRLKRIEYRPKIQDQIILKSLTELQDLWRQRPPSDSRASSLAWRDVIHEMGIDLIGLKNPHFQNEREWRIIRLLTMPSLGHFVDHGSRSGGPPLPVKTRYRDGRPVAYIELSIDPFGKKTILRKIVIGPRNPADNNAVKGRIGDIAYKHVSILRSGIPYR